MYSDIIDEGVRGDEIVTVNRAMRVLEIAEDGSKVKIWLSGAMDISKDTVWHPHELYKRSNRQCRLSKTAGYFRRCQQTNCWKNV